MLIQTGYAFTDNLSQDGSAQNLFNFLASCLITGMALTDFATSAHLVQPSGTVPTSDQGDGSLWFDTMLGIFRVKDNARWDAPHVGPGLTNVASATIMKGALCVMPSAGNFNPCQTMLWADRVGFLLNTCLSGANGILQGSGLVQALVRGPVAYGDVMIPDSALAGYLVAATFTFGYTCITYGLDCGMVLGTLGSTTGLMTLMGWM